MSIEMRAALQTLKFVASVVAGAALMVLLSSLFGPEIVTWLLTGSLFVFGCWMMYSFNLTSLKFKEKDEARRAK